VNNRGCNPWKTNKMQDFKNKLYNYETPPPEGIWDNIADELSEGKIIKMPVLTSLRSKNKFIFYGITAAASLIIIFISSLFFNKNKEIKPVAGVTSQPGDHAAQKIKDSIALNHQFLETIINAPQDKKLLASNFEKHNGKAKKYITIAGPEGQPVKISPKAATLILSADNENPPKPVWNKKIEKWKQIMLNNTTSPTATSLVDILEIAANKDNFEEN
jgi:hypothetical protein